MATRPQSFSNSDFPNLCVLHGTVQFAAFETVAAQFNFLSQTFLTDTFVGVPSTSKPIRPDLLFDD